MFLQFVFLLEKYLFKFNDKDTRTTSVVSLSLALNRYWLTMLLTITHFLTKLAVWKVARKIIVQFKYLEFRVT